MAENFYGITDTGKRREKNEDTFLATALNDNVIIGAVIDGVGGYAGGEVAADIARTCILSKFKSVPGNITKQLKSAISEANDQIFHQRSTGKTNDKMACVLTCAVADLENNKFYFAHVGDTRLYLLRDRSLVKITTDHSVVGFLEESGRLSEEEAMRHPKRNEINKALGFEETLSDNFIETGESPFLPGDILLLCSDGLSDMIGNSPISSLLSSEKPLESKAQSLINAANDAGGKDNITVVLIQNTRQPVKHTVARPAAKAIENIHEEPVKVEKKNVEVTRPVVKQYNRGLIAFLTFMCLVLAFGLLFLYFKDTGIGNNNDESEAIPVKLEKKSDSMLPPDFYRAEKAFAFSTAEVNPLVFFDTVLINKDSFHLAGNGITINADSAFKGPAFVIPATARYVLLDSITFRNFDVALLIHRNNVELKNVRFINCRVPVSLQLQLPADSMVNGRIRDSLLFKSSTKKQDGIH